MGPLIYMEPTPERFASLFDRKIVYAIRNPMTTLPAYHNWKAIKYYRQKGQVAENDWRMYRDKFLKGLLEQWKKQLRAWKGMSYSIGMYLPYERIMNVHTGPALLQRFATLLRDAGFTTANNDDIPCVLHKSLGKQRLETFHKYGYEYTDYFPGYTEAQHARLLHEMTDFMEENKDDAELVEILKGYHADIRDHV